ncbi:hypothetical protein BGX20_004853, partial [Mortierella sp. AD010]
MTERAGIEGSKSNVAMNACPLQASQQLIIARQLLPGVYSVLTSSRSDKMST